MHNQLYKFIEENNILNKWQSGFRPGYSTETAMTNVTDLRANLFKGQAVGDIL